MSPWGEQIVYRDCSQAMADGNNPCSQILEANPRTDSANCGHNTGLSCRPLNIQSYLPYSPSPSTSRSLSSIVSLSPSFHDGGGRREIRLSCSDPLLTTLFAAILLMDSYTTQPTNQNSSTPMSNNCILL